MSRRAVWLGGRDQRVEDGAIPEPGPGQVRVRVNSCGVCMTEVHMMEGHFTIAAKPGDVLGHEFGGVIDAVGPEVTDVQVGTRVAALGRGGFAEHALARADRLYPLPTEASVELASFVEPLGCIVEAVERAHVPLGATVLVTGAGPMGLLTLLVAKLAGASRVIVSEPTESRRAVAAKLGAALAFDPREVPIAEAASNVDVAFETAGNARAMNDCLDVLADGGTAVVVGVAPADTTVAMPLYRFHRRNQKLIGSYGGGVESTKKAARLLSVLDLGPIVSHRFPLSRIGDAFDVAREGQALKVLVQA